MKTIPSYRVTGRFTVACAACGRNTSRTYARTHSGRCKGCSEPESRHASHEEQHARYIDCGPSNWDDR